jgi:hypothetical protein
MSVMNWKQFKEEVEKAGVTDEDEISYIDVSGYDTITVRRGEMDDGKYEFCVE